MPGVGGMSDDILTIAAQTRKIDELTIDNDRLRMALAAARTSRALANADYADLKSDFEALGVELADWKAKYYALESRGLL